MKANLYQSHVTLNHLFYPVKKMMDYYYLFIYCNILVPYHFLFYQEPINTLIFRNYIYNRIQCEHLLQICVHHITLE